MLRSQNELNNLSYIYRTDDALENAKLISPSINCD